jgi:hypothetical protein
MPILRRAKAPGRAALLRLILDLAAVCEGNGSAQATFQVPPDGGRLYHLTAISRQHARWMETHKGRFHLPPDGGLLCHLTAICWAVKSKLVTCFTHLAGRPAAFRGGHPCLSWRL